MSIPGSLSRGCLCPDGGLCPEGFICQEGVLCPEGGLNPEWISVKRGLCPEGILCLDGGISAQGGLPPRERWSLYNPCEQTNTSENITLAVGNQDQTRSGRRKIIVR